MPESYDPSKAGKRGPKEGEYGEYLQTAIETRAAMAFKYKNKGSGQKDQAESLRRVTGDDNTRTEELIDKLRIFSSDSRAAQKTFPKGRHPLNAAHEELIGDMGFPKSKAVY